MTGFQVAPTPPSARAAGPALALVIIALGAMGVAFVMAVQDGSCSYSGTDPASAAACIDDRRASNQAATTIAIIGVGLMVGGCALNLRAGTLAGQQNILQGPAFAGPYPQPPFPQMPHVPQPQHGPHLPYEPQTPYGQPPAPGAQYPAGAPGQQSGPQPQAQPQPPTGPQH